MRTFIAVVALLSIGTGCDKKDDKDGVSIGAPLVQPPVTNNLPAGLSSGATLNLDDTTTAAMATIKDYLYPTNGFVGPIDRLGKIDDRMAELDSRSQEKERVCLSDAPKAFTPAAAMGDGGTIALQLQCQEAVSAPSPEIKESQVGFGISTESFSLVERTFSTDGSGIVVFVSEPIAGISNEVWEARYKSATNSQAGGEASVTWLHIKSAEGSFELATAGSNRKEGALACGLQMRANKTLIYMKGSISGDGACAEAAEYCADATSLADSDLANCEAAGLTTFTMTAMTLESVAETLPAAKLHAETAISGYTDFASEK